MAFGDAPKTNWPQVSRDPHGTPPHGAVAVGAVIQNRRKPGAPPGSRPWHSIAWAPPVVYWH